MAANITTTEAEAQCREFAASFPTANVQQAISLAETGRLPWHAIYDVFKVAIVKAQQEVAA